MKLTRNMTIRPEQPSFGGSSLPKTITLALILRKIIEPELDESTKTLPFDDRVLAWLAPSLFRDMALFHGGIGKSLMECFSASAVAHLDVEYADILAGRVQKIRPDVMEIINELSLSDLDNPLSSSDEGNVCR